MSGGAYINIYQLVDKQGNEVMRGTAEELSIKLKCSVVTVTNAGRPGAKDSTHSNFWLRKKYKDQSRRETKEKNLWQSNQG